jgi:hypothetical protein
VTLTNARVTTEDLLESTTHALLDATSTLTTGNADAPIVNAATISLTRGLDGPVLAGAAGAVADSDAPLHVIASNTARATQTPAPVWNATPTGQLVLGDRGGLSVLRASSGIAEASGVATLNAITGSGFASFSASQTNQLIVIGLAPADTTTSYNEPGTNGFKLLSNATYEVWANGASVNKTGPYTTASVFRIEKTPASIRWFVDDVQLHEVTTAIPLRLVLDLSFQSATAGEIHSIEYDTTTAVDGRRRATVAADGSFKLPILGAPGDAITLFARDGHLFMLASEAAQVATIGNDVGVQSLTFAPNEVTGGRTSIGTVTLKAPAGADGARVVLSSNNATVTVPATLTVAAGQVTSTFTASTQPVAAPFTATIGATYGGIGTSAALSIVKDNLPPAVTISAPAAGMQYTEGAPAGIAVEVTIVDDDSGVAQATVTFDGVTKNLARDLAKGPNVYTAAFETPFVDGVTPATKSIVVTAVDNNTNSATQNVSVVINPVIDSNPPALTWPCFASGGAYASGDAVTWRVTATPPNATNAVRSVQFLVTDAGGVTTMLAAAAQPNNQYQVVYTIPSVADGAQFTVRALVTTLSGTTADVTRPFIVIGDAITVDFGTSIGANTTTYEGKSLVLKGGTTDIAGTHAFKRLVVYSGATVTHPVGDRLDIQAENVIVACGATVEASGRGYAGNNTYPGAIPAGANTAASHLGYGGLASSSSLASTYGSVYHPFEAGFGGSLTIGGASSATGGGIVRIAATTFTNDGVIRANGTDTANGGSGGSVWIRTTTLAGTGSIEAKGGTALRGGGGGAVAIEYTNAIGPLPANINAAGGGSSTPGGAGTILVKSAAQAFGNLTVDNGSVVGQGTELPALGSGFALNTVAGATLVTDRTVDIPPYFVAHWVRISTAAGVVKGTWRIGAIDHKSVTLTPNGTETVEVQTGDRWQGVYRFDAVTLRNTTLISVDPIEMTDETIDGTVTTSIIKTTTLRVKANGVLTHPVGGKLDITASGEVRIDAGGAIDTNGKGYTNAATYPGAPSAGSNGLGGSHIGRGGLTNNSNGGYGSVYRPQELGAAGATSPSGPGGGLVRIDGATVIVDGAIRASGTQLDRAGAGGSVWITAARISGSGSIDTNGGSGFFGSGGGGALAIETTDATSTLPALFSRTAGNYGSGGYGGAGSIYVKGATSLYGDLTVDNGGPNVQPTILPALGSGSAIALTAGNVIVTNRTAIPAYFVGNWVEVSDAAGTVKGTWRISSINAAGTILTLAPNANESINIVSGDTWRGVYRFDNLKLRTSTLRSADPLFVTNPVDKDAGSQLITNLGAPQFPADKRAQIVVDSALAGDAVIGSAGAVVDPDTPIRLVVRNTRTNGQFVANANTDGSFRVPVAGAVGDTFVITASDTNAALTLASGTIPVNGAIVETNTIASMTVQPSTVAGGTTAYASLRLTAPRCPWPCTR